MNSNNSSFWSSRKGAVAGHAGGVFFSNAFIGEAVRLFFVDELFIDVPAPKFAVGYALHGKVEQDLVDLTPDQPMLIIFVRKTPKHDSCYHALAEVREDYPTLQWRELSAVQNGAMEGEPPPYWCMRLTCNEDGVPELDTGCGFDSLDGVVDGITRARPKAPCGLEAPQPQCPDCKAPMESGEVPRIEDYGRLGEPMLWRATDRRTRQERHYIKEPATLPIRTYR